MIMIIVGLVLVLVGLNGMIWIVDVVFVFYLVLNVLICFSVFGILIFIFGVDLVNMVIVLILFGVIILWVCFFKVGIVI